MYRVFWRAYTCKNQHVRWTSFQRFVPSGLSATFSTNSMTYGFAILTSMNSSAKVCFYPMSDHLKMFAAAKNAVSCGWWNHIEWIISIPPVISCPYSRNINIVTFVLQTLILLQGIYLPNTMADLQLMFWTCLLSVLPFMLQYRTLVYTADYITGHVLSVEHIQGNKCL